MYAQQRYNPQASRASVAQGQHTPQHQPVEPTLDDVIEFCLHHRFKAEVVGRWVWVTFDEKPDHETLKALKDFGFHWSPRREKWAHNCGVPSQPGSGNPWDKYLHYPIEPEDDQDRRRRTFYRNNRSYR